MVCLSKVGSRETSGVVGWGDIGVGDWCIGWAEDWMGQMRLIGLMVWGCGRIGGRGRKGGTDFTEGYG
jgi:hypothetical protein